MIGNSEHSAPAANGPSSAYSRLSRQQRSPLWTEAARRARILAARRANVSGSTALPDHDGGDWFSVTDLEGAVTSLSASLTWAHEVRQRGALYPVRLSATLDLRERGYAGDLQYQLYRHPFTAGIVREHRDVVSGKAVPGPMPPPWAVSDYHGFGVPQQLLGFAQVYYCESEAINYARWVTLARRSPPLTHPSAVNDSSALIDGQHISQDHIVAASEDNDGTMPSAAAPVGWHSMSFGGDDKSETKADRAACDYRTLSSSKASSSGSIDSQAGGDDDGLLRTVNVLPAFFNRFVGHYYHTFGEGATSVLPLHSLLSQVDGLGRSILAHESGGHSILQNNAGLDGVPLRPGKGATLHRANLLLLADHVPVNWPDAVAIMALRESVRTKLGLPQDPLHYLRHPSHGYGDVGATKGTDTDSNGDAATTRDSDDAAQLSGDSLVARALWEAGKKAVVPPLLGADASSEEAYGEARWTHPCSGLISSDSSSSSGSSGSNSGTSGAGDSGSSGSAKPRPRVLLIRRRGTRSIVNFDQLYRAIAATGADVGVFDDASRLSPSQVLGLFSVADVIVGTHGAGLTNTLACKAGALVVEALHEGWPLHHFLHFAVALGLRYHRFMISGGGQFVPSVTMPVAGITAVVCSALNGTWGSV